MSRMFPKYGYNPATGEWNDSLKGTFLWSNANVSEAVPDVMTPSTWSLWWIFHYEANPIEFPGDYRFVGNICGRPYLNLSLLVSLFRAVGRDVRKELQGDMIGSVPADLDIPLIRFSAASVLLTALPRVLKARRYTWGYRQKIDQFLAETPDWCSQTRLAIQDCRDPQDLLSLWRSSLKPAIVRACWILRSVTMALGDPATKLHLDLTERVGESDANAMLSNFSGTSAGLESLGPLVGLAQVQKGQISRNAYLVRYGHRGPHEMELYAPGAEEDPDWFEKRMAEYSGAAVGVEALLAKQRSELEAAWQRYTLRFPARVRATQKALEKVAGAARRREQVRSEVTRIVRVIRGYLMRAGEISELGEGVFFLSLDEVCEALAGDKTLAARITPRRQIYQRCSALPPYPALIIGHFDPIAWAVDAERRNDIFDARQKTPAYGSPVIQGIAGGSGIVEGTVRRLDCAEDGLQLQPGEVLVTVTTNVGWTPLFPRLAAIITDVGAPLSHAAIVARELGIPAVVGCGNATMRLKTGDRVRVDGGRGLVEIVDRVQP